MKPWIFAAPSLVLISLSLSACQDPEETVRERQVVAPTIAEPYSCIKLVRASPSPRPTPAEGAENLGQVTQPLFVHSKRLWNREDGLIPVCWEPDTYLDADAANRLLVRNAVESSWGKALAIPLTPQSKAKVQTRFSGWGKCAADDTESIRIAVRDANAQTSFLGRANAGTPAGMILNFTFKRWNNEVCPTSEKQRQACVKSIAVHEFGHALGAAHEHNRGDTDRETCTDAPQGGDGDLVLGKWDLNSVMNYCNPDYNNFGVLSSGDIMGIQFAYYNGDFDQDCVTQFVPARDPSNQKAVKQGPGQSQHQRPKNR